MALFTDAEVIRVEDLRKHESGIETVANAEGLELAQKIELAGARVAAQLRRMLRDPRAASEVPTSGTQGLGLDVVVVTEELRHWLAEESLLAVYQDLSARRSSKRYSSRAGALDATSRSAKRTLEASGVGIVRDPIPRAARPLLSSIAGTVGPAVLFFSVALSKGQSEGAPSPAAAHSLGSGTSVEISSPEGPAAMDGYHVYAGTESADLERQTATPVPIGTAWQLPDSGLVGGAKAKSGQSPDYFFRSINRQLRG